MQKMLSACERMARSQCAQMEPSESEQFVNTTVAWFYFSGPYVLCCAALLAHVLCQDDRRRTSASPRHMLELSLVWAASSAAAGVANCLCVAGIISAYYWAGGADPAVARAVAVTWHLLMLVGTYRAEPYADVVGLESALGIWVGVPLMIGATGIIAFAAGAVALQLLGAMPSLPAQIAGAVAVAVLITVVARGWRAARGADADAKTGDAK